jgi:hypothetical protein
MDTRFARLVEALHPSFERLLAMSPVTTETLPRGMPKSGIYLFSEAKEYLYVGRSNRLRPRIRRHGVAASKHNVASFAFLMARKETGRIDASYRPEGSRAHLVRDPAFSKAFTDAKARIRRMSVRFVEEPDQLRQALLEIYVHVALGTPFNDFATH